MCIQVPQCVSESSGGSGIPGAPALKYNTVRDGALKNVLLPLTCLLETTYHGCLRFRALHEPNK